MKIEGLSEAWAETGAVVLLLIGFLVALLLREAILVYIVILLAGLLAGRVVYLRRFKEPLFPFILMILGFLLGYLLGSLEASRILTVLLFVLGLGVSYYLHKKGILVIFKSKGFIK